MKKLFILIILALCFNVALLILWRDFNTPLFVITTELLVAIFAVHYSLRLQLEEERKKDDEDIERSFSSFVQAMIMECGDNITKCKTLRKNLLSQRFNLTILDSEVAHHMLSKELLYKFLNEHHIINLRVYLYQIQLLNSRLAFVQRQFEKNEGSNNEKNLKELNEEIDKLQKVTLILQRNFQIFANIFDARFGPKDNNETINQLRSLGNLEIPKLEKELQGVSEMNEADRKALAHNYMEAFQQTHNKNKGYQLQLTAFMRPAFQARSYSRMVLPFYHSRTSHTCQRCEIYAPI